MSNFNSEHKIVLDTLFHDHPLLRPGKMFGFPAYFVGKKLCICLYENGVGIKLPEPSVKKFLQTDSNTIPFQPYGKAVMREWIQVNLNRSEDYRQYLPVFEESIQYVLSQQEKPDK
jgi:hypothetical protein